MKTIRILLFDNTPTLKQLIEQQLHDVDSMRISIDSIGTKDPQRIEDVSHQSWDLVLFSEKLSATTISRLAKSLNGAGTGAHTVVLTTQSEAMVPKTLKKAGIGEMLNLADVRSPLFRWTFTSMLKQAEMKKKSENFDFIHTQLQKINQNITEITRSISNPLLTIFTTLDGISDPDLSEEKRQFLLAVLKNNVNQLNKQVKRLHSVRRELNSEKSMPSDSSQEKTSD